MQYSDIIVPIRPHLFSSKAETSRPIPRSFLKKVLILPLPPIHPIRPTHESGLENNKNINETAL
jgi:hypothetical protein